MTFQHASLWVVAVMLAAACGAPSLGAPDESAPPRAPRTAGTAAASPVAATRPAPTADQRMIEAQLGDHFFDPQVLVVRVGTTVTWRNGSGTHDVTSLDGAFRSPNLAPGDSFSHTFSGPGRYSYLCTFHPNEMKGQVVVEPAN